MKSALSVSLDTKAKKSFGSRYQMTSRNRLSQSSLIYSTKEPYVLIREPRFLDENKFSGQNFCVRDFIAFSYSEPRFSKTYVILSSGWELRFWVENLAVETFCANVVRYNYGKEKLYSIFIDYEINLDKVIAFSVSVLYLRFIKWFYAAHSCFHNLNSKSVSSSVLEKDIAAGI